MTSDNVSADGWGNVAPYYTEMVDGQLLAQVCDHFASDEHCSDWK
jgi:hypothetical protein